MGRDGRRRAVARARHRSEVRPTAGDTVPVRGRFGIREHGGGAAAGSVRGWGAAREPRVEHTRGLKRASTLLRALASRLGADEADDAGASRRQFAAD